MIPRLDAAIAKLDANLQGIPLDERVEENHSYTRIVNLVRSLRTFRAQVVQMETMLTKLGV